jgi:putative hydrolase of the HAD superfamily
MKYRHIVFDWGNTLMEAPENNNGSMAFWPSIKKVNFADSVLAKLSITAQCHIATNAEDSSENEIRIALQRAGLEQYITHIFCFQKIGFKKPDDQYFQHIIRSLESPLSDIVMIGNSLNDDIKGALNIGIDAIWFNRNNEKQPKGINTIYSLDELLNNKLFYT